VNKKLKKTYLGLEIDGMLGALEFEYQTKTNQSVEVAPPDSPEESSLSPDKQSAATKK